MTKLEEYRARFPEYNDLDDETLLRKRHAKHYADMPYDEYRSRMTGSAGAQGQGSARAVAQPALSPQIAEQSRVKARSGLMQAGVEAAKDIASIPQARIIDPAVASARAIGNLVTGKRVTMDRSPEEEERGRRATAASVGLLTGGVGAPIEAAIAKAGAKPLLARLLGRTGGGSIGGAADAAIRTGGDPGATLAGAGIGGALGMATTPIKGRAAATPPSATPPSAAAAAPPPPGRGAIDRLLTGEGPGARAAQFFAPVKRRIQAFGEPGRRLERMLHSTVQESEQRPGPWVKEFNAAKLGKLKPDEDALLHDALEGKVRPAALPANVKRIYDIENKRRHATGGEAKKLKVKVRRGDQVVPFEKRRNYFPRHILGVDQLKKAGPDREAVLANMIRNKGYKTRANAEAALDDYVKFKETNKAPGTGDIMAQKMVDEGRAKNLAEAKGIIFNAGRRPSRGHANSLEFSRDSDVDFYDPRPSKVIPKDIQEKSRGLAEIKHLGQKTERVMKELAKIPDDREREEAEALVRAALDRFDEGDPSGNKLLATIRRINLAKFSPLTTVQNLTQGPTNNLLISDVPSFIRGYAKSLTKKGRDRAVTSGAAGEGVIENVAESMGSGQGLSRKWLTGIGFRPAEFANRNPAAAIGEEMAVKWAKKYVKSGGKDKFAARELRKIDLDPEKLLKSKLKDRDINMASLRHSHRGQFRSANLDLPMEARRTEVGRTAFQFKSFDAQQAETVWNETIGRATAPGATAADVRRALRNVAILATVYPAFGELRNDIYSAVMHRERPGKWNKWNAERYFENLAAGAIPFGGTLVAAGGVGRGDRGGALTKWMAGPTVSTVAEGGQLSSDVLARQLKDPKWLKKYGRMTPGQKRQAARLVGGGVGSIVGAQVFPSKDKEEKK